MLNSIKTILSSSAKKISAFNRGRKWKIFLAEMSISSETKTLDVGIDSEESNSEIEENFIEKHYPYPTQLTALGIDDVTKNKLRYPKVTIKQYNGKKFPFNDNEFDVCWSNAVIEHVGEYNDQVFFVKEMCRTSNNVFFSTPNKFFPIDLHTKIPILHFLPKKYFDKILLLFGIKRTTPLNLLSKRKLQKIMQDAGITTYKIISNRLFLFFTLDYVVIIKN